jgi:catechol 2,3-dioxygenase-like lactoylglutathione lyase family enzyme
MVPMMATPEIDIKRTNTILYCAAYEETVRFYRDFLKLKLVTEKDWLVEFRLSDDAFLSVADAERTSIPSGRGHGLTLSWQIDDVRAARYRLEAMGIETSPVAWRLGAWTIFFRDPAGNRIELWS